MDTDSLSPALAFAVFLIAFFYLGLLQYSMAAARVAERDETPLRTVAPIFHFWSRTACVLGMAVSGTLLLQSLTSLAWWPISVASLGALAVLCGLDRSAVALASRNPGLAAPWVRRNQAPAAFSGISSNGSDANGTDAGHEGSSAWEPDGRLITEQELTSLDERDREMLRSILRLEATTVREIMVPRLDMDVVEADTPLEDVVKTIISRGHSRLPVYDDTIDRILGIVHSRDVLESLASSRSGASLRNLVRPAYLIPETKRVDDLLEEFQERRTQIAVVVDEYGGTEGLVTMEDVLEEIVGEIEDEFSRNRESHQIVRQPDGGVLVDARMTTEEVEDLMATRIDNPEADTVGGLVYHILGRIPQTGDVVDTGLLQIEVVSVLGRRLRRLRLRIVDPSEVETSG